MPGALPQSQMCASHRPVRLYWDTPMKLELLLFGPLRERFGFALGPEPLRASVDDGAEEARCSMPPGGFASAATAAAAKEAVVVVVAHTFKLFARASNLGCCILGLDGGGAEASPAPFSPPPPIDRSIQ